MASAGNHRYAKALVFEESSDYNSGESNTLVCQNGILYFNGKQLSSNTGNQFDIFTANRVTRLSGANIQWASNLVVLPTTEPINNVASAGQGFQSDGEFLYYNGIQISAFSNIYQDSQPLTSNSITPLGDSKFVVRSNLQVLNVMNALANTITFFPDTLHFANAAPKITFNSSTFDIQPESVGTNVQFLGAKNGTGSDCNVNFVSSNSANEFGTDVVNLKFKNKGDSGTTSNNHTLASIKVTQTTPFNSSQGGGSMTLTARDPKNGLLGADDQLTMIHMNTNPTANTIVIAPDFDAKIGIMAGYTFSNTFQIGPDGGENMSLNKTSNTLMLGNGSKILTASNVWFSGGTGSNDRVTIGPTNQTGQASVAIGSGTMTSSNSVGIGWRLGTVTEGSVHIGYNARSDGSSKNVVTIGRNSKAGVDSVSIGSNAGTLLSRYSICIGDESGAIGQGSYSVSIGNEAGQSNQGSQAIAIGYIAGKSGQSVDAVSIGNATGVTDQGFAAISLGTLAGFTSQGVESIALGRFCGQFSQGNTSVAIGSHCGTNIQNTHSIAIGYYAAHIEQNASSVAIGFEAGYQGQYANSIAIGYKAARYNQHGNAIAIGMQAGYNLQDEYGIAMGFGAGYTNQGSYAVAIGKSAGVSTQGVNSVAVGLQCGETSQRPNAVAIGQQCGRYSQNNYCVAIGSEAGISYQDSYSVAIGTTAGFREQKQNAVAIGGNAGKYSQQQVSIAIGISAGESTQGSYSVAVGGNAGKSNQGEYAVAVGSSAGFNSSLGDYAIAVGSSAGFSNQGTYSVAVGSSAGFNSISNHAIAVGSSAGFSNQGTYSVAVGGNAGFHNLGAYSTAIGPSAGFSNQGNQCTFIGNLAGYNGGNFTNSICINATGGQLNPDASNSLFIKPIATATAQPGVLSWDSVSGKITSDVAKTFVIDHPDDKEKYLVHGCLEGPEGGVYYRGRGEVGTPVTLPKYVPSLIKGEPTIQVTPIYNGSVRTLNCSEYDIKANSFEVFGTEGPFYWTFTAKRCDVNVEPLKAETNVSGDGPYLFTN